LNATVDFGGGPSDDFQNSFSYDALNRQTQVLEQASTASGHYAVAYRKTAFGYDSESHTTSVTDYSASSTVVVVGTYSFDHTSRLTGLTWNGSGGGSGASYYEYLGWTYDSASRGASMSNSAYTGENLSYTYDHDSQLTSAAAGYGGYGGGYGGGSYSRDGNGDSTLSGHVTGKGNRLLSDATYNYTFDKSGHMTKR
jgi:hypothetical protein